LAGIAPAAIRQQMGHTRAAMTILYSGERPMEQVQAAFSSKIGNQILILESMESEAAAQLLEKNGAAYRNRTDT
jgi:hypothetical protein